MTQAFVTGKGERKILIVNKRDRDYQLTLPGLKGGKLEVVDQTTGNNPPAASAVEGDSFNLDGLGVAVVTLP